MMGRRRGTPRWEDDPARIHDRRCQRTYQEVESPFEGSLMAVGEEMGDRNNRFVTISNKY